MTTVRIDDKDYDLDQLSESAKTQLIMLQATDKEIEHLNFKLAIAQTARLAYAKAVNEALPG
jgi:hypothetical protein